VRTPGHGVQQRTLSGIEPAAPRASIATVLGIKSQDSRLLGRRFRDAVPVNLVASAQAVWLLLSHSLSFATFLTQGRV